MSCYCCSDLPYESCCEPFLDGESYPTTAEALMRSRYSAFCTANPLYLNHTVSGPALGKSTTDIPTHHWINLTILSTSKGGEQDAHGTVEFKATFEENGQFFTMHEHSAFEKINGRWFYVDSLDPHDHTGNCQHCH